MKKEDIDKYFDNVKWFNNFFDGIYQILNELKEELSSKYKMDKHLFYYPKRKDRPMIPKYSALFLKNKYCIQVYAILNDNILKKNDVFYKEPSFIFIIHKIVEEWAHTWRSEELINNNNIEYIANEDGIHHGKFKQKEKGAVPADKEEFYCFQILLDPFESLKDKSDLSEIINNNIINKIDLIFNKFDKIDA